MIEISFDMDTLNGGIKEKLRLFSDMLIEENKHQNLTRITEPGEIWVRHYEDSLIALEVVGGEDENLKVADIGSGAGLPGLAVAIARPNWEVLSVEATGKKAMFQNMVVERLGLDNVTVMNSRAEKLAGFGQYRESFDIVLARAVGHLRIIAEIGLPFLKIGGRVIAHKGGRAEQELPESAGTIKTVGGKASGQVGYKLSGIEDSDFRLVVLEKSKKTHVKFPRPYMDIKARPV